MSDAEITHGESLWEKLDVLRDSGQHGAKACLGMANFLSERATIEMSYGNALIRVAKQAGKGWEKTKARKPVWAPTLVREGWSGMISAVNSWGKQHVGWARCVDQNIAKSLTDFSKNHKNHISRLWAEAQDLVSDLEVVSGQYYKAREGYEQSCIQASRLLDERNKARQVAAAEATAAAAAQSEASGGVKTSLTTSPTRGNEPAATGSMLLSVSKMLGEGMAMAEKMLEKVAPGELSLTELEEKVPEQLRAVDVAETEYIASIMALNGYNTEFQPEMEKKLKEFSLLEECRISHTRDLLLRLDQASKGMLACLLGPGGTLEALSLALSRFDAVRDASSQLEHVRNRAGLPPLSTSHEALDASVCSEVDTEEGEGEKEGGGEAVPGGISRAVSAPEEQLVAITRAREATGLGVLELSEDGCENIFLAGRDGANEAARVLQEICCCLGEVVSVEENYARDLLRLLQRHGYGGRLSQSRSPGARGSIGMMEDVMANMSKPSSSTCAGIIAGQGQTLREGWDCSAVGKALVSIEAHTGLAHALADGSCSNAIQAHNEAKASVKRAIKTFSTASKNLAACKSRHSKAVSRCDKLTREVREKEESLTKARADLAAELQASGGASVVPASEQSGAAVTPTSLSVLESFGLGAPQAGSRVKALEARVAALVEERDAAKRSVKDAIHAMKAALEDLRQKTKDATLTSFAEDSSRHTGLSELLQGILSAFLETAKEVAKEQTRVDKAKITARIDGRKDVQELVERNAARVRRHDAVGEVMFMAYHSEVLQKERDMRRKSSLSSPSSAGRQELKGESDSNGMRRAGGGSHRFSVMAEAAFAQAHAKQQRRQILARQEETKIAGRDRAASSTGGLPQTLASSASLTDGEGDAPSRRNRRYWQAGIASERNGECLSDSEVIVCDNSSASRHGGSHHGLTRRGSRHGSSRHGSFRHGAKLYVKHSSTLSLRATSHSRQDRSSQGQESRKVFGGAPAKRRADVGAHGSCSGSAVQGSEGGTSAKNGPNSPTVIEGGRDLGAMADDAGEIMPADGGNMDGSKGEASKKIGPGAVVARAGGGELEGAGITAALEDASVDYAEAPSTGRPEDAGSAAAKNSCSSSADQRAPPALLSGQTIMTVAGPTVRKGDTPEGGLPSEAKMGDREYGEFMTTKAKPEAVTTGDASNEVALPDASPAVEASGSHLEDLSISSQDVVKTAFEINRVTNGLPPAPRGGIADAWEGIEPVEEDIAPTDEGRAPTEESAPTEELGSAGSPTVVPFLGYKKKQIVTGRNRSPRWEGRPSLLHLENRLRDQDDFSSDGEADDLSSSDDERLSTPARSPTSVSTLTEHVTGKQASKGFNVLESFDLPEEDPQDKVIESYSCGLQNVHGRLYVSSKYALFSGWRNTKVVVRLSDVIGVEKTSTLRIVPNALTLIKRDGATITLGSFLFRDDCYTLLLRLVTVSSSISKMDGVSAGFSAGMDSAAAFDGNFVAGDERSPVESPAEPSERAPGTALPRALDVSSRPSDEKFETMVEAVLPCTTAQVFAWVWGQGTTFWEDFLRAQGETGLSITRWRPTALAAEAGRGLHELFTGETFDEQRELTFTHPRIGFVVGPKKVFTRQQQGFRVERRRKFPGARTPQGITPMDRVVLCQTTMLERGAPMADTFTVLGKIVLSREPHHPGQEPRCRIHVGFDVAFHKSTMLRGAIRAGAQEETRNSWKAWLLSTQKVVLYQRHQLGVNAANEGVASAPPAHVFALANDFTAEEGTETSLVSPVTEDGAAEKDLRRSSEHPLVGILADALGWLAKRGAAAVEFAGVSTVLAVICLLLVARQQREVTRLTGLLEELLEDLRSKQDE